MISSKITADATRLDASYTPHEHEELRTLVRVSRAWRRHRLDRTLAALTPIPINPHC